MKKQARIGKGAPGPGRPKGSVNKVTASAKEAFALAFDELGGYRGMVEWARADFDNLKTFYTLYARLIPVDIDIKGDQNITITREVITRKV